MRTDRKITDDGARTTDGRVGMTLIELLVAFLAFVMLVAALVSLATAGLETWTEGEARKDEFDRAQAILDTITEDLRNTYAENEWIRPDRKPKQPPALVADYDKNRRPRLRFVRTGHPADMQVDPENALDPRVPYVHYTDAWEIAYVMDEDSEENILYRGVRYFDRETDDSLFDNRVIQRTSGTKFNRYFVPLDTGILYVGYKFWTQFTTTWDESKRIVVKRRRSKQPSGPSLWWDSTRADINQFFLHRKRVNLDDPDFVYPEIVQVSLTLESTSRDFRGVQLTAPVDTSAKRIPVSATRGMPDAPNHVKIGGEWIEYSDLLSSEIVVKKRGARGTKAESHKPGDRAHFGRTFIAEVCVPVFREALNP